MLLCHTLNTGASTFLLLHECQHSNPTSLKWFLKYYLTIQIVGHFPMELSYASVAHITWHSSDWLVMLQVPKR